MRAWLATVRWWVWLLAGAVVSGLILAAYYLTRAPQDPPRPPPLPDALQERVAVAEEAALRAKVEASVKAEAQREALAEVAAIDDGAERRRRLAAMLRGL